MERQTSVVSLIEQAAATFPDQTAVIQLEESITFEELRLRSQAIAMAISSALSCEIRKLIGVYLPKCINALVADYGVLYSGNYFLNLDVKAPSCRTQNIVNRMQPDLIITMSCCREHVATMFPSCKTLLIDSIQFSDAVDNSRLRWREITDADPFCVITTSGSTGTPKGVVLPHRGYIDNLMETLDATGLHHSVRMASIGPIDHDFFIYEICFIALSGSTMVMIPQSYILFPAKLMRYMQEMQIDYIEWIPSFMVSIAQHDLLEKFPLPHLREVWYGGEVFPTKHLNYWRRHLPDARFVHFYGPTEASYTCTVKVLDREFADDEPVPIGVPFANTRILVLDEHNEPVKGKEEGELCVLGSRLALGYYNDPEKTEQVFVQNPLNDAYPEMMYRTGDIVSYTNQGELLFHGRKDTLIKHLGYRVELTEVEHVINCLGIVPYSCVDYNCKAQQITLFYEADEDIPVAVMRSKISIALPLYMVPTAFIRVKCLPRNRNDKIDRVSLRCMLDA